MSDQAHIALIRCLFGEFYNKGNLDALDDLFAFHVTMHEAGSPEPLCGGPELFKQHQRAQLLATPDFHITLEDMAVSGDTVACRWTARGTHKGVWHGIAPTGKHTEVAGMSFFHIAEGRIIECWHCSDTLGLRQQLGLVGVVTASD